MPSLISVDPTLPLILAVIFVAASARAAVGFGDALIAMPLLTILMGIQEATPLVGLLALVMSGLILVQSWRSVAWGAAWQLVLASWAGIPVGVLLLKTVPAPIVTGGLGLFLLLFGLYALLQPQLPTVPRHPWLWLLGGLSGALGAAYNTNGPPVVVYGALRRWSSEQFRATMQGYFLPAYAGVVLSHAVGGLWASDTTRLALLGLVPLLAGIWFGGWLHGRLAGEAFPRLLHLLIALLGAFLLSRAIY